MSITVEMQLPQSRFPTYDQWHALLRRKKGVDRLKFPRKILVAGKEVSIVKVLNCFVEGHESLTGAIQATEDDPLEEVCSADLDCRCLIVLVP